MKMRIRQSEESNYKSFFLPSGKTLRSKLDITKPFLELKYPEVEDVAINTLCYANCPYCYTSATKEGINFTNIVDKAVDYYGNLSLNDRPFQIAIGGAGESTIHPDWSEFVKTIRQLEIVPNYTTNGMHLTDSVLEASVNYCGGVALSWHPHIPKVFHSAIGKLKNLGIQLNIHLILGDEKSFMDLMFLYEKYKNIINYIVVLPYQNAGRGKFINVNHVWDRFFKWIETEEQKKFALGALFYNWLAANDTSKLNLKIYDPEMFSGYRIFDDSYKRLRVSSYNTNFKYAK